MLPPCKEFLNQITDLISRNVYITPKKYIEECLWNCVYKNCENNCSESILKTIYGGMYDDYVRMIYLVRNPIRTDNSKQNINHSLNRYGI